MNAYGRRSVGRGERPEARLPRSLGRRCSSPLGANRQALTWCARRQPRFAELRSVRVGETDDQHASRCVLPSRFDDLVPRLLCSLFQLLL